MRGRTPPRGRYATSAARYSGEPDMRALGQRLRDERKRRNFTQEALAEIIGVTPAFIGHIERGERSFSFETLVKLCNALGVTIDYLLADTLSPKDDDVTDEIRALLRDKTTRQKGVILDIMRTVCRNI